MTKTTKIVMNEDEDFNNGDRKTTKLWISPEMELRHAINGWPNISDFIRYSDFAETQEVDCDLYNAALDKAKSESIPVEESGNTNITIFKGVMEPDEFIEFEVEVEVVWQWRPYDTSPWQNTNEYYATTVRCGGNPCAQVRQVARLKPVNKSQLDSAGDKIPDGHTQCPLCYGSGEKVPDVTCKKCEGSGYVPDSGVMSYTEGMTDAEMNEALESLKDPKDARIKELEGAQSGLKDRILEAFCIEYDGESMAYAMLIKALDELKIK